MFRFKTSYGIIELYRNNEIIYSNDDNKTLGQTDGRDRVVGEEKFRKETKKLFFIFCPFDY